MHTSKKVTLGIACAMAGVIAMSVFFAHKTSGSESAIASEAQIPGYPAAVFSPAAYATVDGVTLDSTGMCNSGGQYEVLGLGVYLPGATDKWGDKQADVAFADPDQGNAAVKGVLTMTQKAAKLVLAAGSTAGNEQRTKKECMPQGERKAYLDKQQAWMSAPNAPAFTLQGADGAPVQLTQEPLPSKGHRFVAKVSGPQTPASIDAMKAQLHAKFGLQTVNPYMDSSSRKYQMGKMVTAAEVVAIHEEPYVFLLSVEYDGSQPGQETMRVLAQIR